MRRVRPLVVFLVVFVLLGLGLGGTAAWFMVNRQPMPWSSSCTAALDGRTVRLEPAQVRNAAIITGVALQRGLDTEAVTIGLATALQESGLRNLDHGDRDSLGLFQQRPSQGWGTPEQVQDPYYAAEAFFKEMVKVKGWKTMDVGDVAQAVQRSGYPDAYDKRIPTAQVLAAALTGAAPAALTCVGEVGAADATGLTAFLGKTLPAGWKAAAAEGRVTVAAPNAKAAWAASAIAMAHGANYGVRSIETGGRTWRYSWPFPGSWSAGNADAGQVAIGFR